MKTVKACPFCGFDMARTAPTELLSGTWMIMCPECYAQGPLVSKEIEALKYWNRRVVVRKGE